MEIVSVPPWLNGMPLDSADHVRQGWRMIGHPMIRGRLVQNDGLTGQEAAAVIETMRRRIRKAAWEHDVVLYGS